MAHTKIASLFVVSEQAVRRHRKHLSALLVQSQQAREVARANDLLVQMHDLQQRAMRILALAEATLDLRCALMAIREARENLTMQARLAIEAQKSTESVLLLPEWVAIQNAIVNALEGHPEARQAVLDALSRLHTSESTPVDSAPET